MITQPKMMIATTQTAVTSQPSVVNFPMMSLKRVPVFEKKVPKTRTCRMKAKAVTVSMTSVSTARSVTTVPSAFGNAVVAFQHTAAGELTYTRNNQADGV